ncbi:hypothetical protein GOP47_0022698 [Adiantum capillus-veneris]|uniref:Domain X domain-containing protein n=1 Tax=Adiantum capillus-veneris TaxID=13818 RepID=A0A9D4U7U6_ADICA|nr:hypothetical protein GOP47_0022698 [Adiantum capillus-veneris]
MLACLRLGRRQLHSKCVRLNYARDPAYLGLFEPQQQASPPSPEEQGTLADDEQSTRDDLRIAFCYKFRDWARTTRPEYISRPPSKPRPRRSRPRESASRVAEEDEIDQHVVDDDEDEESYEFEGADDGELDIVDDEDELNALDNEQDNSVDNEDSAAHQSDKFMDDFHVGDADEKGKLKFKPIHIIAPKDEIYQRLNQSGLVSSKRKRPMPVPKLVKKSDAQIVGWYYYCSIELLQFFKICHNLKEVKAIVEYHIRWSAIGTLAKKYKCNPREIVKKYGRDLECEDKKGKKVRLMTRQEIKEVSRGVNKRVEMIHRFRALNILDEMD